ncbi:MAG: DUF115 domain-containing protein [Spirochaetes bacterium]|nr:DUF115 domain-containing protein [Spirochaetota bacterium]
MIDREQLYGALNEGVAAERMPRFRRNLEKNAPLIARYGGLKRLVPELAGRHAVVVGAGPSLDRHVALLGKYQFRDTCVVISADMALKALAAGGVRPRFVFSCETTPVDYFGGIDTTSMHLVAFSCMSPVNLRRWRGDISFYNWMIHTGEYERLWERAGRDLGYVATGNIITTQAVSFALGCGVASLVMVGNDLGYTARYYARGTAAHSLLHEKGSRILTAETMEYWNARSRREYEIRRGDRTYYTNSQFLAAKLWLEDLFKKTTVPVYDCGEPGCSGGSAGRIRLEEYFARFERGPRRRGR